MQYNVVSTPVADLQIDALRGRRLKAYERFEQELARRGCAALGYRLTGDDPLSRLCVKHLHGSDRVVVAFVEDNAWVLLVGPHNEADVVGNIYAVLYELVGVPRPSIARTKPFCCGENAAPPEIDEAAISEFARRARGLRR